MENEILNVLNTIQKNASNHQKHLKIMENIYNKVDFNAFIVIFLKFLRVTFFADTESNAFVERTLDFFAKCVTLLEKPSENESEDSEDSSTHPLLYTVIEETLKFHDVADGQTRYNACKFITLILKHIGYNTCLDGDLCDDIQEAMLIRIQDPKPSIRLQAVKALVRLQEPKNPECPVVKAYMSLMCDASAAIRREIVKQIARNASTISRIRHFISDIDASVRVAAFSRCADIGPKLFSIEERQQILSCGFLETNKQARQVFLENLLPKWLAAYSGDTVAFLYALKLDAKEEDFINSEKICKQVMEVVFKTTPLKDILSFLPLGPDKLIALDKVTSHIVVYWAILVQYLNSDTEEYLDSIRPELTPFCNYVELFIKKKNERTMDTWEYTEYQYILYTLFQMTEFYDLSDEVGRQTLHKLSMSVLQNHRLEFRTLCKVMTIAEKFVTNVDSFVTEICEIISEIHEPLIEKEPSQKDNDEKEFQVTKIKVQLTSLQYELEMALAQKEYQKCAQIQNRLAECRGKLEEISQPSQTEKVRVSKEDPDTICRCLDILTSVLMLKSVRTMCPALRTCKDEFLSSLLASNFLEVNWRVLKCLAYYCLMDKQIADEFAKILCIPIAAYRAVANYNKMALMVSVTAVTDLIRFYGPSIVGVEDEVNATSINSTRRRLFTTEDMDEANLDQNKMTLDVIIEMMLEMLDDENEEVRDIAITAIGRLIFHEFPVSPTVISRLILKWFSPLIERSAVKLQLKLGHLIDHYTKTVEGAKEVIGKAVIPIIQKITSMPRTNPLAEIDIDNVAKFLAIITSDMVHVHISIAHDVLLKISNKPTDEYIPALTKVLTYLDIPIDNTDELKELIAKAELVLEEDEGLDKIPKRNVLKFIEKVRASLTESNNNNQLETIVEDNCEHKTADQPEETITNSVENVQNEIELPTKRTRNHKETDTESEVGEDEIIEQSDTESGGEALETATGKKSIELNCEKDKQPSAQAPRTRSTRAQTQKDKIPESEKTIIDETPPEDTSSESSSSPTIRQKQDAIRNQVKVRIERIIQTRRSRNADSSSADSMPPSTTRTINESTNKLQKSHVTTTTSSETISSNESSPKRARMAVEDGKLTKSKTTKSAKKTVEISTENSSTESKKPFRRIKKIQKSTRTRPQMNYKELSGSSATSSSPLIKDTRNTRKVVTRSTSESSSDGSGRSSVKKTSSQMHRRSQRQKKDVNDVILKESNKENKTDSRRVVTRLSASLSSTSTFNESKLSRPVAESTRNNISANTSSHTSNTSRVLEGGKNMPRNNNLHRISEESLSSSLNKVQTKRKKARGSAVPVATRLSKRLSQRSNASTLSDTVLHTIIMEDSHEMELLEESDNSIFLTPKSTSSGRRSKTVISQTSSDSDSSPIRKSTRKIKKKRMDEYIK